MGSAKYDVFISYRRAEAGESARLLQRYLHDASFSCFLDVDDIGSGHYDESLIHTIEETRNFIVVFSKGCFDRCTDPSDWFRREIVTALRSERNIIPVTLPGFSLPTTNTLPEELRPVLRHQTVNYSHEYFHAMFEKLLKFLQSPRQTATTNSTHPRPVQDEPKKSKIELERIRRAGDVETVELTKGAGLKMVWCPAGSFMMGSPDSEEEHHTNEGPVHRVTLKGFWMGKYAVTQGQWEAVMGNNPSHFKGANLPVEQVSWTDCQEFIKKVNAMVPGGGFRLPSEAEWEYACRAGTTTAFSFGETITPEQANYDGNYTYGMGKKGLYRQKTVEVGSLPGNAWGLHEMHGNVLEWCQDWFHDTYQGAPTDGSAWEDPTGERRMLRGGSWDFNPKSCRSALRARGSLGPRGSNYGFRLSRTP